MDFTKVSPINPQQQKKLNKFPHQYFYLRLMGIQIQNSKKQLKKDPNNKIQLKFQMGSKICKTNFKLQLKNQKYQLHPDCQKDIQDQTYLLSYEGQEMLNIRMKRYTKLQKDAKKPNVKQKQKNKISMNKEEKKQEFEISNNKEYKEDEEEKKQEFKISQRGFCRVPITSFILFPYTCHKIDAKLIQTKNQDQFQFTDQVVGILKLQLYYILKFEAKLKIYLIQGNFQSISPDLGQMNLCLAAKINQQRKKSKIYYQGGIHPKWHQYGIKQNKIKKIKKLQLCQDNCLQFKLESVGDILQLDIINFPLLDRDAEIFGSCKLKLENQDFFRVANQPLMHKNSYKILKMYAQNVKSEIFQSGKVTISYQFIYDVVSLRKAIMGQDD